MPDPVNRRWRVVTTSLPLLVPLAIAYGSLYPFDFSQTGPGFVAQAWRESRFLRPPRGDLVANLLLYLPIGLLVAAKCSKRNHIVALLLAASAGGLLSVVIETLQWLEPSRVSSLTDVVLNVAGAVGGALFGRAYLSIGATWAVPGLQSSKPPLVPLLVVCVWLLYRCAPYVPTIDLQKYKEALRPLRAFVDVDALAVLRYAAGWLVVLYALRLIAQARWNRQAAVLLVAATLLAQVVIVDRVVSPSEILALGLVVLAVPAARGLRVRGQTVSLVVLSVLVLLLDGLAPYSLVETPSGFSWLPFGVSLSSGADSNLTVLVEKTFRYGTLLWLLERAGMTPRAATLVVLVLVSGVEVLQLWLPGRYAEITDPLLVLLFGVLLGSLRQKNAVNART